MSSTLILTRDAAPILGEPLPKLCQLIRTGRMVEPARDSSKRFIWTEADLEAARRALQTDRRRREHRQTGGRAHV
jgi:hypothetical protein